MRLHILATPILVPLCSAQSFTRGVLHTPVTGSLSPWTAGPQPTGEVSPLYKLFDFHGCNSGQQKAVLDALTEKNAIMEVIEVQKVDFSSAAAVDYFGEPSVSYLQSYRSLIQANLQNIYHYNNGWWLSWNDIDIFCGDGSFDKAEYKNLCRDKPGHLHFVNDYNKHDGLMFCDSWFRLSSLSDAIASGKKSFDPHDITNYENRARHWISALIQKKGVGIWPLDGQTPYITRRSYYYQRSGWKWMTTPSAIKYVAKRRDQNGATVRELAANLDTWSWFAMAAFLSSKKQLDEYAARPYVPAQLAFEWQNLDAYPRSSP